MRGFLTILLLGALVGCTSVQVQTDFRGVKVEDGLTPIEVVDVYNTNWLFLSLDWLPIASGDPDNPIYTCLSEDLGTAVSAGNVYEVIVVYNGKNIMLDKEVIAA